MANLSSVLEVATATHSGMVRSHNEDSLAADIDAGLAVLADGMGGYNAGEVASGIAVELIRTELKAALESGNPEALNGRGAAHRRKGAARQQRHLSGGAERAAVLGDGHDAGSGGVV